MMDYGKNRKETDADFFAMSGGWGMKKIPSPVKSKGRLRLF